MVVANTNNILCSNNFLLVIIILNTFFLRTSAEIFCVLIQQELKQLILIFILLQQTNSHGLKPHTVNRLFRFYTSSILSFGNRHSTVLCLVLSCKYGLRSSKRTLEASNNTTILSILLYWSYYYNIRRYTYVTFISNHMNIFHMPIII
ncbi:Uncharacterized protein FWK35_00006113 [Aphis craccivora]|uniref:Uncharacterized protein n=1 Tax=Aphis craccivora TaxID=307492 RepID=A0A6G0YP93_APHCR|nr:Uncharacterized protein FWK35_00006113 [Aphis craccivora]